MFLIVIVLALAVGLYARHRYRVWRAGAAQRRALAAADKAKAHHAAKRPLTQRVHARLPARAVARVMRWKPQRAGLLDRWREPRVVIARRGLLSGPVRINPAQHILAVGLTGSGKSSTLRVLGAWALRHPRWMVEVWDGKYGVSARPYAGRARALVTLDEIEARLAELVDREFPARSGVIDPPHLALIIDESRIFNELSPLGMARLIHVVQLGRELGVHVWAGLQDPKTSSIPSELRDQFTCKLAHLVQTAEASQVIFKELAAAGWRPDKLERSGQLLVWEPTGRTPRPVFGLWLSPAALAAEPGRVCLVKARPKRRRSPVEASDRPSVRDETPAQTGVRTPGRTTGATLTDRQSEALTVLDVSGARTPAELGRELGIDRKRAHDVLAQLTARGLVSQRGDGAYALIAEVS